MRAARYVKHGLERVERTGADVAKHHAKGGQAQGLQLEAGWSGVRSLDRVARHCVSGNHVILSQNSTDATVVLHCDYNWKSVTLEIVNRTFCPRRSSQGKSRQVTELAIGP